MGNDGPRYHSHGFIMAGDDVDEDFPFWDVHFSSWCICFWVSHQP